MAVFDVTIMGQAAQYGINAKFSDHIMMRQIGLSAVGIIKHRTTRKNRGISHHGGLIKPLKAYSRKKIWLRTNGRDTRGVKPGGGKISKSGRTMFFPGGYREFKEKSTGGLKPNYTLSGVTMADSRVLKVGEKRVVIGFAKKEAISIASGLNNRKGVPFFGLSKSEVNKLAKTVQRHAERLEKLAEKKNDLK